MTINHQAGDGGVTSERVTSTKTSQPVRLRAVAAGDFRGGSDVPGYRRFAARWAGAFRAGYERSNAGRHEAARRQPPGRQRMRSRREQGPTPWTGVFAMTGIVKRVLWRYVR